MPTLKFILLSLIICATTSLSAQNFIQSISAKPPLKHPVVSSKGNIASGAKLILDALGGLAQISCQGKLQESLELKLKEAKNNYSSDQYKGKSIKLLALVNNSTCKVYSLVQMDQIIRVQNNTCSVDDIHLVKPDIIFDHHITSFFVVQLKIE